MAHPWIIMATSRTEIGAAQRAVRMVEMDALEFTVIQLTDTIEHALRFRDEPEAALTAIRCNDNRRDYLFTPYRLF